MATPTGWYDTTPRPRHRRPSPLDRVKDHAFHGPGVALGLRSDPRARLPSKPHEQPAKSPTASWAGWEVIVFAIDGLAGRARCYGDVRISRHLPLARMVGMPVRRLQSSWPRWLAGGLLALTACSGEDDAATPPSVTAPVSAASAAPGPWQTLIDEAFAGSPGVPGIALAVLAPDEGVDVAVASGSGGLTPAQPFRIASNTKTFTAAATLRLVEDGVLGLDDPIGEHLSPSLVDAIERDGYDASAITVRHLLQHTSGLYDYASDVDFQVQVLGEPSRRWTREEQVRLAMMEGDPLGEPGEVYAYSDTGYVLLGDVIERATGETLGAAYRDLLRFDAPRPRLDVVGAGRAGPGRECPGGPRSSSRTRTCLALIPPSTCSAAVGWCRRSATSPASSGRCSPARCSPSRPRSTPCSRCRPPTRPTEQPSGLFRSDDAELGRCWLHAGFWGTYVITCPEADVTIALSVFQASPDPPFDGAGLIADAVALAGIG